ncbi:MAG TPA: nucleotidyltransferase domain-containing protein [Chitinophagales bacterium]|nr:nucleotidyltransferase domain-containing protein [Chitinophagales bacterium]
MKYGLKKNAIQSIQEVFKLYPQINNVVLYGSRAKGNFRPNSDIDLTIKGEDLSLKILFKIETDLDDLLLPYKMDVSLFNKIENQDLVAHIERVGVVFYEKAVKVYS